MNLSNELVVLLAKPIKDSKVKTIVDYIQPILKL